MLSARELIAGVMFRSLLAAAEAKWTAAAQWNQTDRAGAIGNPESNTVFALRSALPILPKSGLVRIVWVTGTVCSSGHALGHQYGLEHWSVRHPWSSEHR